MQNGLSLTRSPETELSGDGFGGRTVGWDRVKVVRRKLSPIVRGGGFACGSDKAEGGTQLKSITSISVPEVLVSRC